MTAKALNEEGATYCSVKDVEASAPTYKLGQGQTPTPSDVLGYIEGVESEINAILTNKGYAVPVEESAAPLAFRFVRWIATQGAVAQLYASASSPPQQTAEAKKTYAANLKLLSEARSVMDAPQNAERTKPRGPGVTTVEAAPGNEPFFSRSEKRMQF